MTEDSGRTANILLIEDDQEDQWATKRAFSKGRLRNTLYIVDNGAEALDFLYNRGNYEDKRQFPRPDIILLDLNLPVLDGRAVLTEIKESAALRALPVIVLTTSTQEEDILRSYNLGVNSYISKPVDFEKFIAIIQELSHYWLELVVLPPSHQS